MDIFSFFFFVYIPSTPSRVGRGYIFTFGLTFCFIVSSERNMNNSTFTYFRDVLRGMIERTGVKRALDRWVGAKPSPPTRGPRPSRRWDRRDCARLTDDRIGAGAARQQQETLVVRTRRTPVAFNFTTIVSRVDITHTHTVTRTHAHTQHNSCSTDGIRHKVHMRDNTVRDNILLFI